MTPTKICHVWSAGDRLPELFGTYQGVDLTGSTVTFYLERPTTTLIKPAIIITPTQGRFKISWDPSDLVTGLEQRGTIIVTDTAGFKTTIARFQLDVTAVPV